MGRKKAVNLAPKNEFGFLHEVNSGKRHMNGEVRANTDGAASQQIRVYCCQKLRKVIEQLIAPSKSQIVQEVKHVRLVCCRDQTAIAAPAIFMPGPDILLTSPNAS